MNKIECKYKFQDKEKFNGKPYCTLFNELCENVPFVCDTNCQVFEDYKQLQYWKHQAELGSETCDRQDKEIQELQTQNEALKNCDKTLIYIKARANFEKLKEIKEIANWCKDDIDQEYCGYCHILQIINQEE